MYLTAVDLTHTSVIYIYMKYLVYTPYRCGSSFVTRFIEKNHGDIHATMENISTDKLNEHMVFKVHEHDVDVFKTIPIDHILTCIRKPTDIFMSAYIKDFKTPGYPYEYNKEPIIENIDDMVDHFLSFDWGSFNWCSYDYNFEQIQKLTNLNIWYLPTNNRTGISFYPGEPNLTVITHRTLFDDNYFTHFQQFCHTRLKFKHLDRGTFSYRNTDTYGDLYNIFKNKIPQSFFNQYKDLDNRIISKFFNN